MTQTCACCCSGPGTRANRHSAKAVLQKVHWFVTPDFQNRARVEFSTKVTRNEEIEIQQRFKRGLPCDLLLLTKTRELELRKMLTIQADLVVIGGGGAGLPAALTALEGGITRVVLLEKRQNVGGNASMASGMLFAAESNREKETNDVIDKNVVFKEVMAFNHYDRVKPRILRAFVDKSGETIQWLEDRGAAFKFARMGTMPVHIPQDTGGQLGGFSRVIKLLSDRFQKLGGQILLNTAAEQIICDEGGRIEKVIAKNKQGDRVEIHTNCIFLSCGGFTGSTKLLKEYFSDYYSEAYWTDAVPNMGDGIQLARSVGAGLSKYCTLIREPAYSFEKTNVLNRAGMEPSSLWVNTRGERFADESIFMGNAPTNALTAQPGMLGFALFDARLIDCIDCSFKKSMAALGVNPFSIRNAINAEAKTRDWCVVADSFDEIAAWIGADPEILQYTIKEYNSFVASGHDGLFAKDKLYLVPLATPPFYALKFRPLMIDTIGPVEINEKMEVLDSHSKKIPGFYAGGAIASGWLGNDYYLFGSSLAWAVNSGRIAAENAIRFLRK